MGTECPKTISCQNYVYVDSRREAKLCIVARATYAISSDGSLGVVDRNPPIQCKDILEEDGITPRLASDLTPPKTAVDFLVLDPRCKVNREGRNQVLVQTPVRTVTMNIWGRRALRAGRWCTIGQFKEEVVPLTFSRAFGGMGAVSGKADYDDRNPVGKGFGWWDRDYDRCTFAPQIELNEDPFILDDASRPTPIGLTPVGPSWGGRRCYAGTYDKNWVDNCRPFLPLDFENQFYNSAHPLFQVPLDKCRGDYLVKGLIGGDIQFSFKGVGLELRSRSSSSSARMENVVQLRPNTIVVDPINKLVDVVWSTAVECQALNQSLQIDHGLGTGDENARY